jgi:5-methyltetrahydrofolate--homocysteine methyltransferase
MTTILQGRGDPLILDPLGPARAIGERINPSGKKKLLEALVNRNWTYLVAEAQRQAEAGADIIDVNVGGRSIDDVRVLPEAVRVVQEAVQAPLCIDTRSSGALKAALAVCQGRPLVNSVSGEKAVLESILPIVAEHKVPVVALCMGSEGIPKTAVERVSIAHAVFELAVKAGVKAEDVLFDPLVLSVGADDQAGRVALETISLLRKEFPRNCITGGASNISFGMPLRPMLNANFIAVAVAMGMNVPITDVTYPEVRYALLAADIFLGRDPRTRRYLRYFRSQKAKEGGL